jgi:hypothetical protein
MRFPGESSVWKNEISLDENGRCSYFETETSFWLAGRSLQLDFQLTNLSPEYLLRFVSNLMRSVFRGITRPLRAGRHAVQRLLREAIHPSD